MTKDYYKILGVDKNASKEDIKRAYKKLAKQYHPDINKDKGAADKFKEINEAASVLADDKKRQQYDNFGTAEGFGGFDFGGFDFGGFDFGSFNFDDIFNMFTGGGRGRRSARGDDLRYDMEIDLEEAATGTEKEITVPKLTRCERCKGTGAEKNSDIAECEECNGSGYVRKTTRTPFGIFQQSGTCRACGGQGRVVKHPCSDCDGQGRYNKNVRIKVKIPAGVRTGTQLRIEGEGEAGARGGQSGDLYVFVNVRQHKIFDRQGDDIYVNMPIAFTTAALGGEIEVPTLNGKAKINVPAGTQTDTYFRLKGKGIKSLRGYGSGDLKVKVIVQTPASLNKKQKEILRQFEKELGKKGVFSKIFS
jgi:molecular chaperone DnaJ